MTRNAPPSGAKPALCICLAKSAIRSPYRHAWTTILMMMVSASALADTVAASPVANTGTYTPNEMAIDRATGEIYLNGFPSGSTTLSIVKVTGGSLTTLYATLPGTIGGNLQYTNGFAVDGSNQLWWNNANAALSSATEFSRAPTSGAGPITRNSPGDDEDSLTWSGTTLFTAYYAGTLYSVTSTGDLNYLGFHRWTSHLALASEGSILYVIDDSGAYKRNADGTFTDIISVANTYRTNGSRATVGGGYLYALDRNLANGF